MQRDHSRKGFERREVEKRFAICLSQERKRLTASAAFHGYILSAGFEQRITELKTKINVFMNNYPLFAHNLIEKQRAKKRQRQANRTRRRTGGTLGSDLRSKAKTLAAQGFSHFACIGNVCLIHCLSKEKYPPFGVLFLPIWGFFDTLSRAEALLLLFTFPGPSLCRCGADGGAHWRRAYPATCPQFAGPIPRAQCQHPWPSCWYRCAGGSSQRT